MVIAEQNQMKTAKLDGIWDSMTGWVSGWQQQKLTEQQTTAELVRGLLDRDSEHAWVVPAALGVSALAVGGLIFMATR